MKIPRKKIMYFGILLLIINFYFKYSQILNYNDLLDKGTLFLGLGLLVFNFVLKKEKKTIIKLLLVLFGIFNYYFSKQSDILQLIVVMVSLYDENIKDVLKFSLKINLFMILSHMLIYFILTIFSSEFIRYTYRIVDGEKVVRFNFLFIHANLFASLITWTFLAYLHCYGEINKKNNILFFLISFILVFFLAKSRTSSLIILSTYLLFTFYNDFSHTMKKMLKHVPTIIVLLSILLLITYDSNNFSNKIDILLENRIKLGYAIGKKYGYHLLPNNINFLEKDTYYSTYGLSGLGITIDSTYYKMILCNGILTFILFIFYMLKKIRNEKFENKNICFYIAYSLFLMVESFGYYPLLVFPILLLGGRNEKNFNNNSDV